MRNILKSWLPIFDHPLVRARRKLEESMRRYAMLESEARYTEYMSDFYGDVVNRIDPSKDWWRYAEEMQKLHDTVQEYQYKCRRVDEAMAKTTAWREEVKRLEGETE